MKQVNGTRASLDSCCKGCKIHLRCEGKILEDNYLPDEYEWEKCRTGYGNKTWFEEKVNDRKMNLEEKVEILKAKHNNITMDIERLEEEESIIGPRQKKFKESCKKLGINPAIYHGGDLEGKAVQTLLDSAREKRKFEILECLVDKPDEREKYVRALSTLAKVSDALKTQFNDAYDDDDVMLIKRWCEEWGHNWQKDFKKNFTPKAHDMIFVLPEFIKIHRTYHMFYKVEQAGESIHAVLNDIHRKIWSIRDGEQKLWKFIERYELRNVLDVDIVAPVKRVFKNHK